MRRKIVIIVASIAVVLVLGLVAVALLFDVDKYRPQIQSELQKKLNRPVSIGKLGLRIFPLSVRLDQLTVGESPAFPSQAPFAAAQQVFVSVGLFSLISGNVSVKSVRLEQPHIQLIRNASGVWNFSTLGNGGAPSSGSASSSQFSLDQLRLSDGKLTIIDQTPKQLSGVYDHVDIDLDGYAPGKRFSTEVRVHLPGEGQELLALNAKVGPIPQAQLATTPATGNISLKEVSLAGVQKFLALPILEGTNTVISGDTEFNTEGGAYAGKGKLTLSKTVIHGVALDSNIDADFNVKDDPVRNLIEVKSANVKLGQTPISLSGTINSGATPATVDLRASTKNAPITELAKIAGAVGVAFNPKYQIKGNITTDLAIKGEMKQPAISGSLNAANLEVSGGEIKQPVRVPSLALTLTPESIRSNEFTAESGSTKVNGALALSQYTGKNPLIDATLKTQGANIADLLSMAKAYGVSSAEGMSGTGVLSLDVHAQGPVSQSAALKFSGSGKLANAVFNLPSLTKPVNIANADVNFRQNQAALDNLALSVASTNLKGNLAVSSFTAPQVSFKLSADKINVDELQGLTASNQAKPSAKTTKSSTANQPSLLDKTTGSGTLSAGTIAAKGLVLTNVQTTCTLDKGVIKLSPLSSTLFSGKQTGSMTVDTRPANYAISTNLKLAGVDTNQLLSAISSVKNTLYGSLGATANTSFQLAQDGDITRTLNGNVSFAVANGRLEKVNILNELSKVGKFLGGGSAQKPSTDVKQLSGTLNIQNGVANTDNLVAVIEQGSLSGKGAINLVSQALNLHVNAVLGQAYSKSVGGSGVGGYLNTALANKSGELVLPVIVTGTFAKPMFAPDVQAMAEMKVKNLLPTTGDPAKLGSGILNSVLGGKSGSAPNTPGAAPAQGQAQESNPVDSIFKALKKKKQK